VAIPHAKPGQTIDISPLGPKLDKQQTTTLVKTHELEVIRLVLPAGKEIRRHSVPGEITVQCLEGKVAFCTNDEERELTAHQLLYLDGSHEHALRAMEDSSVLVTILLQHKADE
jgi:quercetin dioxygenase-like cupin family protein